MNYIDEKFYIEKCKAEIERTVGIGESINWKQRDFEYLCEQIFNKAKTNISLSTIKRIWNTDYKSTPQPATLNALAVFLGFEDWNCFKKSVTLPEETVLLKSTPISVNNKKLISKKLFISLLAGILILAFSYAIFNRLQNKKWVKNLQHVKFELKKTDTTFPNSVIFYYDVTSISPQKLSIQQSWDSRMTVGADPKSHYRTCIYYYPGYFRAKLIDDDKIIKETDLVLNTKDWFPTVIYTLFDSIPKYIRNTDFTKKQEVYISPTELTNNGIKTEKDFYILYSYCKDFNKFSSDNFVFETTIKNSIDDGALLCQTSMVYLACENGWINIPLTNKGCISDLKLFCSELYLDGKSNDLSAFGCDMNQWHTLRLENVNRNLAISIDGKLIYKLSYKSDLGCIYEIAHLFKGCGRFKDVILKKTNENAVFKFPF